jgi:hypothetical protein
MKKLFSAIALFASLAVVGCDSGPKPATVNSGTAKSNAQTTISAVNAAVTQSDGQSAANQLSQAAQSAQNIVTPQGAGASGLPQELGELIAEVEQGLGAGTCDCTANACTFVDCENGGYKMNGSMSWSDTHLDADLSIAINSGGLDYTMQTTANLDVTPTSINGSVTSKGNYSFAGLSGVPGASSANGSWDASIKYNNVTFPQGGGAPTGGSIDVSSTTTTGGQTYQGSGSVSFP